MSTSMHDENRAAPMVSAPFVYDEHGQVAWGQMWDSFCALALDGGPPHRGEMLAPVHAQTITAQTRTAYEQVVAEICRGIHETTGLMALSDALGWVAVVCDDEAMAAWLCEAIVAENVAARHNDRRVFVPAAPSWTVKGEIKNVITAVAKTVHYYREHRIAPNAAPPVPENLAFADALAALQAWVTTGNVRFL